MKVLAAMSGGVDSAVAAARVVDAGHEVVGVHLALSRMPGTLRTGSRGCCTIEDSQDAWKACEKLGIPYYVWDFSERFKEDVVDDFISEYEQGRTPNPCLRCNEKIKFAALLEKALALGFDAVCTGHYAKVITNNNGEKELHRAADWAKDQSYVLGVLNAEQLEHCIFPLADTPSKAEVRAEAAERGISVAKKPDSHDICFIPDGDTRGWLADKIEMKSGEIVDEKNQELGKHEGAQAYTVGQRKGLRIGTPAPDGKPRYVLEIRPKENKVIVGPERLLQIDMLRGIRVSWAGPAPETVQAGKPEDRFECMVQVRAHGDPAEAWAWVEEVDNAAQLLVQLKKPMRGVAPGQSMVIYVGSRVLGQATISEARSLERVDA
ncbi:MAG: tRNA 2-thiouridine(34) synthase MnmA [Micrococcaceae bacterium]